MSGRAGLKIRPTRKFSRDLILPLGACALSATLAEKAGFVPHWKSGRSEAVYYKFPGRKGVLRIAGHSKGGGVDNCPTVVSVTFPLANEGGFLSEYIENHTANGIGVYLIRAEKE